MKLPNAEIAVVEQAKICGYLLNSAHRFGASKARFFAAFDFTFDAWDVLAVALKQHAAENEVVKLKQTGFGPRYEVEGELATPDRRRPRIRSIWQMDEGQGAPRLITAYPLEAIQ